MPLKIIEIGINEDGEHAVTLVGDADAVKAAAKLWGEPVELVDAHSADPKEVSRANTIIRHQAEEMGKISAQLNEEVSQLEWSVKTLTAAIVGSDDYSLELTTAAVAQMARDTEAARKGALERAELAEAERDKALDEATDAMSDFKEAEANLIAAIAALQRIEREGGGRCAKVAASALTQLGQSYLARKHVEAATASWPDAVEKAAQKLVDKAQAPYRLEGEIKAGDEFIWKMEGREDDKAVVTAIRTSTVDFKLLNGVEWRLLHNDFRLHAHRKEGQENG